MDQVQTYVNRFIEMAVAYAPKLVLAIVALLIGLWIINNVVRLIGKAIDRQGIDRDVRPFLTSLVSVILKVALLLSIAGIVGIETTSFVAVIAAAGFAVGLALQGSLANFASGVMVLIFKPYRVGDLINVQGQLGHVKEIQIFNTILTSLDNKTVIVPNSLATSGVITNFSTNKLLRVDLNVGIAADQDFETARRVILDALAKTDKVSKEMAPTVAIEKFETFYTILAVRPYATDNDYWDVYFGAYENIRKALAENGIKGPHPSTTVNLRNVN